jgi:hypothetical protein
MLETDSIILYYKIPIIARYLRRKSEELRKIFTRDQEERGLLLTFIEMDIVKGLPEENRLRSSAKIAFHWT